MSIKRWRAVVMTSVALPALAGCMGVTNADDECAPGARASTADCSYALDGIGAWAIFGVLESSKVSEALRRMGYAVAAETAEEVRSATRDGHRVTVSATPTEKWQFVVTYESTSSWTTRERVAQLAQERWAELEPKFEQTLQLFESEIGMAHVGEVRWRAIEKIQ